MERKTRTAAKTADDAAPAKTEGSAPSANVAKRTRKAAKTAAKRPASGAPKSAESSRTRASAAKGTPKGTPKGKAKTAAKSAPTTRATGPTPERIALANRVAKLRAIGTKWNDIAAETGKSEPTLATLRKDVRAGKFANVSPAKSRIAASADGSGPGSF